MHKSATKCNETLGKWCKNKHGASKIIDTLETYQVAQGKLQVCKINTYDNLADMMTKPAPVAKFELCSSLVGIAV
jgi:hypothetical protein